MRALLFVAAVTSIVISALIVWTLFREAWQFLSELTDDGRPRRARSTAATRPAGTRAMVGSTCSRSCSAPCIVSGVSIVVAAPLGLGAAVYLSEYASPRTPAVAEADPRDPGRHPQRGVRLLRSPRARPRSHPAAVRHPADHQPAGHRRRHRRARHAADGVDLRRRAPRRCRSSLREASTGLGARKQHHRHQGRRCRQRCRASWPHSSSPSPARSARRWWPRSRPVASASRPARSTHAIPACTMTAAMAQLATGSDQVVGVRLGLPEPVLRRRGAVPDDARPQHDRWTASSAAFRNKY